jgi:hypothetical protein
MGALSSVGPGRIEDAYQASISDPNRLAPQASGYLSRVLSGQYLDPNTNPGLGALSRSIWETVAPNVESVFSRAGRGTSDTDSGLAGALTRGFTSALAAPLFAQYGQERGFQQSAAGMAPSLDAVSSLPLDQYLERMRSLATLGQQGTTTATASPLQTIAGLGLIGGSLFSAPAGGTSAATGIMSALGALSDRRVKTDIEHVGDDPRGWGIYEFRYRGERERRRGFMADEVVLYRPDAVLIHPSGYLMVDYEALQ